MPQIVIYSSNKKLKYISTLIAQRIEAEIVEVKDTKKRSGFFNNIRNNYNALRLKSTEIEPQSIDFKEYDLVMLASPSTLGNPSPAILTLIENSDFEGSKVIIYTTTESTNAKGVLKELKKRIEQKGGEIVNTFIMYVNNKTDEELKITTIKVLSQLDIDLYI